MLYSYDEHSESAKLLASKLKIKMIKHTDSTFRGNTDKFVINWGSSDLPLQVRRCTVINDERWVDNAINKLTCLRTMNNNGVRTVPFCTDILTARQMNADGAVVCRTRLRGFDGDGIILVERNGTLPEAKLYTQFIPAEREYRITVVNDPLDGVCKVVAMQRKVRLDNAPAGGYNDRIRITSGGYGFKWVVRGVPDDVLRQAKLAIETLHLDFGGVDVLWDGTNAHVLEVNTAPHLTENAATCLANALRPYFEE